MPRPPETPGHAPGRTPAPIACAAALVALCVVGCEPEVRVIHDPWASLPADPKVEPGAPQVWSIELDRFVGPTRQQQARALVKRLQEEAGFRDVDIRDNAGFTVVSYGRFGDPNTADAQAALQRVRAIELDGIRPYEGAGFGSATGLSTAGAAVKDPLNLRRYPGMYTLQIGLYDPRFGPNYRKAAEEAVAQLRKDKIEAYFYHGKRGSMITVGLFTEDEALVEVENPLAPGTKIQAYSPLIRALREKFPYNLGNGVTLIEKNDKGEVIGEQPSSLTRIPDA